MENAKGLIITGIVTVAILVGGAFLVSKGGSKNSSTPAPANPSLLVNSQSHQTNPQAKVTIVEFGDYRCPACKEAYPATKQLLKDYDGKINFVFRNYPFLPDSTVNLSPTASTLAANSAECAADQGKFWEMHDYLYQNQPAETDITMYTLDNLTKIAGIVGIDTTKFRSCLANKTDDNRVKQDYADGQELNITGTPTFFVNNRQLSGVPTYSDFKAAIDPLLK